MKEIDKLRVVLPHWIEHNTEHAVTFHAWAPRSRSLGKAAAAGRIDLAVQRLEACNEALAAALEDLGQ